MQPVVIRWPGGEHAFRLGLAELETIQQKTDCGPEFLLHKLNAAQWNASELVEVLRSGLIGGGMPHVDALKIVRKAFDLHPLISFKVPAQEVLASCLYGPPDDVQDDASGEADPVEPTPENEKTASGLSG
ncbi:MAG: gene transfer agent family protein [Pseudomonadota bacterium]|nr:gene transfer agent family protein [Pseudomonadota bacterium]